MAESLTIDSAYAKKEKKMKATAHGNPYEVAAWNTPAGAHEIHAKFWHGCLQDGTPCERALAAQYRAALVIQDGDRLYFLAKHHDRDDGLPVNAIYAIPDDEMGHLDGKLCDGHAFGTKSHAGERKTAKAAPDVAEKAQKVANVSCTRRKRRTVAKKQAQEAPKVADKAHESTNLAQVAAFSAPSAPETAKGAGKPAQRAEAMPDEPFDVRRTLQADDSYAEMAAYKQRYDALRGTLDSLLAILDCKGRLPDSKRAGAYDITVEMLQRKIGRIEAA